MERHANLKRELGHQPSVRYINGLTIYFAEKQAIYVTDGKVSIVLERWFESNFAFERKWDLLNRVLKRHKSINTVYQVWNIAMRYEICPHMTFRFPEIKKGTREIKEDEK